MFMSSASCSSTGTVKGSIRQGDTQVASYLSSGASTTSRFLASALARAIATASAGRRFHPRLAQIVRSGKAPAAVRQHADTEPGGFGARNLPRLAVLGRQIALPAFHDAHVGVADTGLQSRVQGFERKLLHGYQNSG